ncbi:GGDEF domain-containing protein [Rhodococcoides kroppenstedtii]|uniref:GGDEF domain-containing protein n=1 Tax=Rhodococcoides kroppenstedtii TaxID=293050 RepID=A0ABS7NY47_9NOCA|nr:GGDEF domain-containing protein [Rhodococcus kroppenstedtii]
MRAGRDRRSRRWYDGGRERPRTGPRANLRAGDIACRTGGDEFVALLRSSRSADSVERLAARVRLLLAGPYLIDGVPVPASVSVGWSWDKPVSPEKLLHIADERMYSSKRR